MKLLLQSDWQADNMTAPVKQAIVELEWKGVEVKRIYMTLDNLKFYDKILNLLIPTLNWKDNPNVSFSTGGGHMCVIRKTDDHYTTTAPVGFTGTLDECKHYCSVWVRDEYLKLCGNG